MSKGWKEIKLSGGGGGMKDTPKGLGIKDGGCLAFMFRSEDEDGDEEKEMEGEGTGFVVEWPSYEDNYGEMDQDEDMEET